MNYRHAFHAGNHADVLKHLVLLAVVAALQRKDTPMFALDTHAGRGRYDLAADSAKRTGESASGVQRLLARPKRPSSPPALARYLHAVRPHLETMPPHYPGSPLLLAEALRADDRLACCELQPDEASALKALLAGDARIGVHQRDGYDALAALLPPKERRGLVLIDPPYEAQRAEFDQVLDALRDGLARWPGGVYALWYPIKRRRELLPFLRLAARLPVKGALLAELLVRADDSPLRLNGSGMLLLNPPWQLDQELAPALPALREAMGEHDASHRLEWLVREAAA